MAEAPSEDPGCQVIREWMKAKGFFDTIIEEVLSEKGISDTDGLILVTQSQWDEIVRLCMVAQRAEESDSAAEKAMENKLNKIEKEWRILANLPKKDTLAISDRERPDESSRSEREDALAKGAEMKAFLKKEGCLDMDMLVVLVKNGVTKQEELSALDTIAKWDEVVRQTKLMRGGVDREDMMNLEKKLAKVERIWRTQTGISVRDTDFKKPGDSTTERKRADESSAVVRDEALAKGAAIKAFLKKSGCLDIDFVVVLVRHGVLAESDIGSIDSQKVWDEIVRETKIERGSADREEEMRLENNLAKFEKIWRTKTGITKGPSGSKKKKGGSSASSDAEERKDESSAAAREDLMRKGADMKQFLKKNQCLNIDFLCVLVESDVCSEADISKIDSNKKWDEICRKTRVARGTTDATELAKVDATLGKFEKLWRAKSGVKKPIGTGGKKKKGGSSRRSPATSPSAAASAEGAELKAWMRKNQIFEQLLLDELVKLGCKGPTDFKNVSQTDLDNALRAVRVAKRAETKDHATMTRLDKKLNAFEKLWKAEAGGSAAAGGKKKKKKKAAAS